MEFSVRAFVELQEKFVSRNNAFAYFYIVAAIRETFWFFERSWYFFKIQCRAMPNPHSKYIYKNSKYPYFVVWNSQAPLKLFFRTFRVQTRKYLFHSQVLFFSLIFWLETAIVDFYSSERTSLRKISLCLFCLLARAALYSILDSLRHIFSPQFSSNSPEALCFVHYFIRSLYGNILTRFPELSEILCEYLFEYLLGFGNFCTSIFSLELGILIRLISW